MFVPFRSRLGCGPVSRSLWLEGLQEQGEALGPPSPESIHRGQLPDSFLRTWLSPLTIGGCFLVRMVKTSLGEKRELFYTECWL